MENERKVKEGALQALQLTLTAAEARLDAQQALFDQFRIKLSVVPDSAL